MNKMLQQFNKIILSIIYLFFFTNHAFAQQFSTFNLSPPDGFTLNHRNVVEFANWEDDLTKDIFCENKRPCNDNIPGFKNGKFIPEGKTTKALWVSKQNVGRLAVIRSYESAIIQIGGKRLSDYKASAERHLFFLEKNGIRSWILISPDDRSAIVRVLEEKSMKQLVTASAMAEDINKQGFVTLNVNFDNNKAVIKDADKPTINEVVTLLKNDAKLKLSVEGHTDNVGSATANKTLSQNRADSLVAYMVAAGISANRLVAKGFGSEVSIADNRTEDGKAKNRRVELVKIK